MTEEKHEERIGNKSRETLDFLLSACYTDDNLYFCSLKRRGVKENA